MWNNLFNLRGDISKTQSVVLGLIGLLLFLAVWWLMAELSSTEKPVIEGYNTELPSEFEDSNINRDSLIRLDSIRFAEAKTFKKVYPILPPPNQVFGSFPSLVKNDKLIENATQSIWLNIKGYVWAILISIPLGFLLGLLPLFRGLFSKHVDALRYLPLTALTGLFIIWFGIEDNMKIAFLAFGIIVYLLPVVVQRIHEVDDVYIKTVFTLGASKWQTIREVFIPAVMSKLMDDIRVLTAISWTYIIIAELINRQGGIGSLIYIKARQGQLEKVFAILIVIIIIGFVQDRLFLYLDKRLFPFKTEKRTFAGMKEIRYGLYTALVFLAILVVISGIFGISSGPFFNFLLLVIAAGVVMTVYGEFIARSNKKLEV